MLEDDSQEKSHKHQEHAFFSVMSFSYDGPHSFQDAWHNEDPEERKVWHTYTQNEFKDMIYKGV